MPGLTVAAGSKLPKPSDIEAAHQHSLYDDRYEYQLQELPSCRFATALYPSYPIETLEYDSGNTIVIIEGCAYNRDADQLKTEINTYLVDRADTTAISNWLKTLDGEFIFYVHDAEAGEVTVISDPLGQLPLFYATDTAGYALVGRNKPILTRVAGHAGFDQLAVAQYLRIGYALSDRTLFENIRRVPDGTIIRLDLDTGSLALERIHQFDFSTEQHETKSLETNARELATRFTDAARRRAVACPGTNTLLLSGGLDSRGVMGAFERAEVPYTTATRDFVHDSRADIEIAEKLAAAVDADWNRVETPAPTGNDLRLHLEMAAGTDPFNIAHIQPFLRRVRADVGDTAWTYTGDGGDKLLPDLSPVVNINSKEQLAEYILTSESKFSAEDVEAMTGVSEAKLVESVLDRLDTYPESTFTKQFLHFELFERAFAWLFEATDTNRNHLWTTSPYYAPEVVAYAMNCPDEQKRHYRLFSMFLEELSPELSRVQNANIGAAPSTRSHVILYSIHDALQRYPRLLEHVLPVAKLVLGTKTNAELSPVLLSCLREQLKQSNTDVMDSDNILRIILADAGSYSRYNLCLIFTLSSLINQYFDQNVLMNHLNEHFK